MQKEELIQLHTLFVQIKEEIEQRLDVNGAFQEYEEFGVYPHHIHKSKNAHKKAIFILGKEIARIFSHNNLSSFSLVAKRLEKMEAKI